MIELETIPREELFDELRRGSTVVTATRRLSGVTRQLFDGSAAASGIEVWRSPVLLPWRQWIRDLWEAGVLSGAIESAPQLLTQEQELHLWDRIVRESLADQPLQQVAGTVREAQEAWQLLNEWRVPLDEVAFRYNHDSIAFSAWAAAFNAHCSESEWLSQARLADVLADEISRGTVHGPSELLLLGFDELTPQQHALLELLRGKGASVRLIGLPPRDPAPQRVACADPRGEAETMARWVRERLTQDPSHTIGVIVPDLAADGQFIGDTLDRSLIPGAFLPGTERVQRPYNISLGRPLAQYPLVVNALTLLRMSRPVVTIEEAGGLLLTPYVAGWPDEAGGRALLDRELRDRGELSTSLARIHYLASQEERPWSAPHLATRIGRWIELIRELPARATTDAWADHFARLLQAIGWAEGRALSSEEFQTVEAWQDLLGSLASLHQISAPFSGPEAANVLQRLALGRSFQPRSEPRPVQVLGMLEAMGLEFDHLWIMGLEDTRWPPAPRPNPFIPLPLQREGALPRSGEQRELAVARRITRRMLTSADHVIVSFPERRNDEVLRASPLVAALPFVSPETLVADDAPGWVAKIRATTLLEEFGEDPAPELDDPVVRGGSTVFRLQAACPFHAFAEIRLGADALTEAEIGIAATIRGALMHRVLERVWQGLDSHAALVALSADDLAARVERAVLEAIEEFGERYRYAFTRRLRELERARLAEQAEQWLALERVRPPFRVIAKEAQTELTAGGVVAKLRIDRIDELADGRLVLIDYKTGQVTPADWFGERPKDPQLPLYSLAVDGPVAALLFARVAADTVAFSGVAEEEGLVPGVGSFRSLPQSREYASWQALRDTWRNTLTRLGESFCAGDAAVDPTRDACTYCHLAPLCRIHEMMEQRLDTRIEDDGESGGELL